VKYLMYLAVGIFALLAIMIASTNPNAHARADIDAYAEQLFAFGAVRYVHGLDSDHIRENQRLFDQVESGAVLDPEQSCAYRGAYEQVLYDYARHFQAADDDLQMKSFYGTTFANNCGGYGVAGHHDLHDISAKANFEELTSHLAGLQNGLGWTDAVLAINEINKNLIDLSVHMAPATHTIGVRDPAFMANGMLSADFNTMQTAFKTAQFEPVNSPEYWTAIDAALKSHADIIFAAQDIINRNSTPLQRRIAGRFLSLQTVAPRLDPADCVRPRPNQIAPACANALGE